MFTPRYYKIVSGRGESIFPLAAFDKALCNAGIGDFNLVKVSSILPANCTYSEKISLDPGSILYAAYATITIRSGEKGQTAVSVAIPENNNENGVIFENSLRNCTEDGELIVQSMCQEAMELRNREIKEIKKSSQCILGMEDMFVSAISAVVMW